MEGMRQLQFSDLFTELPVPPQAAGVVGTFNVLFIIYHSEHYGLILDLKDTILVLQGLLCLCTFILFLQVHFACALCV